MDFETVIAFDAFIDRKAILNQYVWFYFSLGLAVSNR